MITPNDIETKVFSYSVRGYNKREVDEFLDQIMIDYQSLLDQNAKMMERIRQLQSQTPAGGSQQTLEEAKKLMNDISASAEQRAEVIIHNAEADAANIVSDARSSTTQAGEDAAKLREKIEKFKERYKRMLQTEMDRVDDESQDLLDDMREDFYPEAIFDSDATNQITRATGLGVPAAAMAGGSASKGSEHEDLDLGEFAPESEQGKQGESDPLLARAEEADVDVEDLPGFRSSAHNSKMDDTVIFKGKLEDTMDLDKDEDKDEADDEDKDEEAVETEAEEETETEEEAGEKGEPEKDDEGDEDEDGSEEGDEEDEEDEDESETESGEPEVEEEKTAPVSESEDEEADQEAEEEAEVVAEADAGTTGNTISMDASEIDAKLEEKPVVKEPPQTREERVREFKETAQQLVDGFFSRKNN